MKTIAYYISEYGYGHAARSIALMREMLQQDQRFRIVICTSFSLDFIKKSLEEFSERVIYHQVVTDIGYILEPNSLNLDKEKLNHACHNYISGSARVVNEEVRYLSARDVDCIISDISPIAFEIGDTMKVPTIGISNFTWWSAYQGVIEDNLADEFYKMYRKMDHFFQLAGSNEHDFGRQSNQEFGFFSRTANAYEVERIHNEINPSGKKAIVFVPVGMKINMDMNRWRLWDSEDSVFVVSSHMDIKHPNVVKIPSNYTESQNYVAASDLVISKAGWGTVSEAVIHEKPLFILDRKVNEDITTIRYLLEHNLCNLVSEGELEHLLIAKYSKAKKNINIFNETSSLTKMLLKTTKNEKILI